MDNPIATVRTGIDLPKRSDFVLNSLFFAFEVSINIFHIFQ
jgi:hypothetical protein